MKHNGSMLSPSMGELKAQINNRYLLVNVAAQLARDISQKAEEGEVTLDNKPVTIALHEIADGDVVVVRNAENTELSELHVADEENGVLSDEFTVTSEEDL